MVLLRRGPRFRGSRPFADGNPILNITTKGDTVLAEPLHPMIVHIPMALAVLMPLVAGGILVAWWRGYLPKRSWSIVCALQLVLLASSLLAMRSGENDEDRVEHIVPESAIEHHEHAAKQFTWGAGLLLVVSLLPLSLRKEGQARTAAAMTLTGALVVLWLGYRVGEEGGELVYKHGAAAAFVEDGSGAGGTAGKREHDDDEDRR